MLDKNILIGVTGGIAAYKVVEVASRLKKSGANVKIIMTKHATELQITPCPSKCSATRLILMLRTLRLRIGRI